jgi:hypothetical protein
MSSSSTASQVLDHEFLTMRCKLLELAAAFDRIDRAEGSVASDPRIESMRRCMEILAGDAASRAERIQLLFSLPYEQNWRETYCVQRSP